MRLIETYTKRSPRVKGLPPQLLEIFEEHGMLLPANYPFERLKLRRRITSSMWKKAACWQALRLQYWDRLVPASKRMPLMTGTFLHTLVGLLFIGELPEEVAVIKAEIERWARQQDKAFRILKERGIEPTWKSSQSRDVVGLDALYAEANLVESLVFRWLEQPRVLEPVAVNVKGRVPIRHPGTGRRDPVWDYAFEFDAIARHKTNGSLWVHELKSSALMSPSDYERSIDHDPQRWGYPSGARALLASVFDNPADVGICYDVLGKSIPSAPAFTVCKKGPCGKARKAAGYNVGDPHCGVCAGSGIIGLSKQAVVTTPDLVEGAIAHLCRVSPAGREAAEKGEFNKLRHMARKEERLAYRLWLKPSREETAAFWSEVYRIAHETQRYAAAHAKGQDLWPRQRRLCRLLGGCSYAPICPDRGANYDRYRRVGGNPGDPVEYEPPLDPALLADDVAPQQPEATHGYYNDPDVPF